MKEKKIEIKDLKLDEPVKGFRKGMSKKKLLSHLTDEDWEHIDQMKEAQERFVKSDAAFKLYVLSEQMSANIYKSRIQIKEYVGSILENYLQFKSNKKDILLNKTEKCDAKGVPYTVDDLKVINYKIESDIMKALYFLRDAASKLYAFVGHKGLDKKIILTEEAYENEIQSIQESLSSTPYKLL